MLVRTVSACKALSKEILSYKHSRLTSVSVGYGLPNNQTTIKYNWIVYYSLVVINTNVDSLNKVSLLLDDLSVTS